MPGSNKKQVLFRHFLWNVQKFTSSEENIFAVLLVFLWEMPVMNGYEAAKAIRASGRADADIPIIAMTAEIPAALFVLFPACQQSSGCSKSSVCQVSPVVRSFQEKTVPSAVR